MLLHFMVSETEPKLTSWLQSDETSYLDTIIIRLPKWMVTIYVGKLLQIDNIGIQLKSVISSNSSKDDIKTHLSS